MPRIINVFRGQDPTAAAISRLGGALFAPKNNGTLAQQREEYETGQLGKIIAERGIAGIPTDNEAQARLFMSGRNPGQFADQHRFGVVNDPANPLAGDTVSRALVGAGGAYSSTPQGFGSDQARQAQQHANALAQDMTKFNMTPEVTVGPDGQNIYAPRSEVAGQRAPTSFAEARGNAFNQNFDNMQSLDPAQQAALGAEPSKATGTPRNYILADGRKFITLDGVTDAQTGQPLEPGGQIVGTSLEGGAEDIGLTNAVKTDLQSDSIAHQKFNVLLDMADQLTGNPENFGPVGLARSLGQELAQGAIGTAALFQPGAPGDQALNEARTDLAQSGLGGLLPEIYDPNLSKVQAVWGLLVYQGAAVLAGQQGRSVSDKDVLFFKQILGDPQTLFSSAEMMKAKLAIVRQISGGFNDVTQGVLGGGVQPGAAPAPAAQPAPQGGPVQIGSDDDYIALPSGAEFIDPEGIRRRKP